MYCKHCGKKIDDDSAYCKYCGEQQNKVVYHFTNLDIRAKLIIGIDLDLDKKYFSDEYGYLQFYTDNSNMYWLERHLFFLYKDNLEPDAIEEMKKQMVHERISMDGKYYNLFIMALRNGCTHTYMQTHYPTTYNDEDCKRLLNYWGMDEKDVFDFVLYRRYENIKLERTCIGYDE